ncbi:anaerobic ribonucleoside-triphosphate reductase activating protein [Oscillospiraceae bacterium OttesenSCG-928-G22]|nr:anaerobic ribonucleoside-triphosphate reductase activating protein [Oscillospiraceae bacterium OttesenSCG-928-G22]
MSANLRVFGKTHDSIVDGPGLRFTLFLQGCPHQCPGCHNPKSHAVSGGTEMATGDLLDEIRKNPLLDGVTLSGGEPFLQAEALLPFARGVAEHGLNIWIYSGYTFEELLELSTERPAVSELLRHTDALVDGRYVEAERSLTLRFRGSKNQRILDARTSLAEGRALPLALPDDADDFPIPRWG